MGIVMMRVSLLPRLPAVAALLLFFFSTGADGASLGGKVENGSGGALVEPVPVALLSMADGEERDTEDARGGFLFEDLPGGENAPFLLTAEYLGVVYRTRMFLEEGAESTVVFTVFDTTHRTEDLRIEEMEIAITKLEGHLVFDHLVRIVNEAGSPATVVWKEGKGFVVPLPEACGELEELTVAASDGVIPVRLETGPCAGKSVAVPFPLRPGYSTLAVRYLAACEEEYEFHLSAPGPVAHVMITAPSDMEVTGTRVTAMHRSGQGIGVFLIREVETGEEIVFHLSGGSVRPEEPDEETRITTGPYPFQGVQWWIIPAVFALFTVLVFAGRRGGRGRVK